MMHEVTDFEADVLEASRMQPVLVDFWAPWCGPCRVLGPVLEKLAAESEGSWSLVKINTDENPELATRYGIRGIPAVKLFSDGAVVDEFTGAMPEYAIRQWLEKALPSQTTRLLDEAQRAIGEGDPERAEPLLREVLRAEPDQPKARVLLAQLLVFDRPEEALELVAEGVFAGPGFLQIEEAVRTIAPLLSDVPSHEALPDEPGRDAYRQALEALAAHDFDEALERFIEVVRVNRYYRDDAARKACVALFTLLGDEHPAVQAHRRTFDMALY